MSPIPPRPPSSDPPKVDPPRSDPRRGLCPICRHVRVIESERGSRFLLCSKAKEDPSFPRYPPQPRLACAGYEPAG